MHDERAQRVGDRPIAPSRLLRPRWHAGLLHRGRLTELLERSCLTVVSAPAGYGKTTLLADFARSTHRPCIWLRLDGTDRDETHLLASLTAAADQCLPANQAVAAEEIATFRQETYSRYRSAIRLARRLSRPPRESAIVLDDFHSILDSEPALGLIRDFMSAIPDYVHIVVATRVWLPQSVVQAGYPHEVTRVGSDLLRFDVDEVESYLTQSDIPVSEWWPIIEQASRCEGWPAAITLLIKTKRMKEAGGIDRTADPQAVFDRLAAEMFAQLPEAHTSFLRQIANLQRIVPDLCDECLGRKNSRQHLKSLLSMNLFLAELAEGEEYRLHGLFREFLLNRAQGRGAITADQHRLAAEWFQRSADSISEIRHLIHAGELRTAATRIDEVAPTLTTAGRSRALQQMVDQWQSRSEGALPAALARWKTYCQYTHGDWSGAIETASRAIDDHGSGDARLASLYSERSYARRFRGELELAIQDAEAALRFSDRMSPNDRVDALRALGTTHAENLNWTEASTYLKAAVDQARIHDLTSHQAMVLCDLAVFEQVQGHIDASIRNAERAVSLADSQNLPTWMTLSRNNLATALHLTGRYSDALARFREARAMATHGGQLHIEALLWLGEGDVRTDLLQTDAAYTCCSRGLALAQEIDAAGIESYALRALSKLYRVLGDLGQSRAFLEKAERRLANDQRHDHMLHLIASGALSIEEGNLSLAAEQLHEAVTVLSQAHARIDLARARLFLAYCQFHTSGAALAIPELERLHELVAEIGHNQFLVPDAARMPRMWGAVAAAGRPDLHEALVEPDLRPRTSPADRGLPAAARFDDPSPDLLDAREREVVISLCEGLSREEIASRLGLSRSTVHKLISAVYASTGFAKAYQIVAWAHRSGLFNPLEPPPPQIGDPGATYDVD